MSQSVESFLRSVHHLFGRFEHYELVVARDIVPVIPLLLIAILLGTRCWRWRYEHWLGLAAFLIVIFEMFHSGHDKITATSAGLLILAMAALSPWWRQIPLFLKEIDLPGGAKVEFRDHLDSATQGMRNAGLLSEPTREMEKQPIYELIYNDDPRLSLAGLRIAIERRLRELATTKGIKKQPAQIRLLMKTLEDHSALTSEEASALHELLPLLNQAVRSQAYSKVAADWAIRFGPLLLAGLGKKASTHDQSIS
jgi:hypothetical protein